MSNKITNMATLSATINVTRFATEKATSIATNIATINVTNIAIETAINKELSNVS